MSRGLLLLLLLAKPAAAGECAQPEADCTESRCCAQEGQECYQKDDYWAVCKSWCAPGERQEGDDSQEAWSCNVLSVSEPDDPQEDTIVNDGAEATTCATETEDCSVSRCCADESLKCFRKNEDWAGCKPDCTAGMDFSEADGQPWSCELLSSAQDPEGSNTDGAEASEAGCAADGEDCSTPQCCSVEGQKCFRKDEYWAACKAGCSPGLDPADEDQTPWSCEVLGSAPSEEVESTAADESTSCTKSGGDCSKSKCCQALGDFCFQKDMYFAQCAKECTMAPDKEGVSWTCEILMSVHAADGTWDKAEGKARWLLNHLRPEAKTAFLHGAPDSWGYSGLVNPQVETRIPGKAEDAADMLRKALVAPLRLAEGTQGFKAPGSSPDSATRLPAGLALAATFNPQTAVIYAKAVAAEFSARGANVCVGPDVTVIRTPLAGQGHESISGEDPYLGSEMAKPFVKVLQDAGIVAAVKYWLNRNEETYQKTMDSMVDERTQREIYARPFEAAFAAGAGAVVCPSNKVNGQHACESGDLLGRMLRDGLGFRGFVVSQWDAVQSLQASANAGLDLQMPGGSTDELAGLLAGGLLTQDQVEQKVVRVLGSLYAAGHFDGRFHAPKSLEDALTYHPNKGKDQRKAAADALNSGTGKSSAAAAVQTIVDGAVLLKNDGGALPISKGEGKIALLGQCAGGAAHVESSRMLMHTEPDSLQDALKDIVGKSGTKVVASGDASAAKGASVAVVCLVAPAPDGWDRMNLTLPDSNWLVAQARDSGVQKVIVLAITPGAVTTEWLQDADAALLLFAPGGHMGAAAAKLLMGLESPAGRLPVTLPKVDEKRFHVSQYPGQCQGEQNWCEDLVANFSEGSLVGYRWNDAKKVPAAFAFGFGLGYTDFKFDDFKVDCASSSVAVQVRVTNIGGREGIAVPQLYVQFGSLRPAVRQLRGFRKVILPAGGQTEVTFVLSEEDWQFYDVSAQMWRSAVDEGDFITVHVGKSSADLLWSETLSCEFLTLKDNSGHLRPLVMGPPP